MASMAMSPELSKGDESVYFPDCLFQVWLSRKSHHNILTKYFILQGNKSRLIKKATLRERRPLLQPFAAGLFDVELDALRKRQRPAVIDGVGRAAHIGLPGIRAGFAAAAGLLLAAKGATNLGA